MALRSAVELSPHREEIDKMLLRGESPRTVSSWLESLEEGPESISHTAINNYRKKHLNVNKEAVEEYQHKRTRELKKKEVQKVVSDLEYCDNIIELADKVNLKVDHDNKITELDIKKIGLQAVKVKHDITKDEPEPAPVNVNVYNNTKIERLRRIEENGSVLPITSAAKPDNRVKEDSKE
jgi:hypothetical protein